MNYYIAFWKKHLNWFIPFVSEFYPLTKFQLLQYEDLWDWSRISANTFIEWSEIMKNCFKDNLRNSLKREHVLHGMSDNPVEIVYPTLAEINDTAQHNRMELLEIWKSIEFGIYIQEAYNEEALMLLVDKFDCGIELDTDPFGGFHMPAKFIEERKDFMDWSMLSLYWGLNWSIELLKQFEDYWVTEQLIKNHTVFNYCLKDNLDDVFIEKVLVGK